MLKVHVLGAMTLACLMAVSGCSAPQSSPQDDPAYVPPNTFSGYNCKQIAAEQKLLSSQIDQAQAASNTNQFLNAAIAAMAISKGQGYSQGGGDTSLERLKNKQDILQQTAIQKQCGM